MCDIKDIHTIYVHCLFFLHKQPWNHERVILYLLSSFISRGILEVFSLSTQRCLKLVSRKICKGTCWLFHLISDQILFQTLNEQFLPILKLCHSFLCLCIYLHHFFSHSHYLLHLCCPFSRISNLLCSKILLLVLSAKRNCALLNHRNTLQTQHILLWITAVSCLS